MYYIIYDTRTGEIVWRCECPIRAQQVVDIFNENGSHYAVKTS